MKHLDINLFMQDVHQNAIAHGWWEKERTPGTIRSLIHAELSEALEEYRAGRPLAWHGCTNTNKVVPCENHGCSEYWGYGGERNCAIGCMDPKPEGIAVELMDFVIRIFDCLAKLDHTLAASMNTAQKLSDWALDDYQDDQARDVLALDLPDLVDLLHDEVSLSSVLHSETYLTTAAGIAMAWVEKRGMDPVDIILEKHRYNQTRPYKHGGKVC